MQTILNFSSPSPSSPSTTTPGFLPHPSLLPVLALPRRYTLSCLPPGLQTPSNQPSSQALRPSFFPDSLPYSCHPARRPPSAHLPPPIPSSRKRHLSHTLEIDEPPDCNPLTPVKKRRSDFPPFSPAAACPPQSPLLPRADYSPSPQLLEVHLTSFARRFEAEQQAHEEEKMQIDVFSWPRLDETGIPELRPEEEMVMPEREVGELSEARGWRKKAMSEGEVCFIGGAI